MVLFVHDVDAAAVWYAALLGAPVKHQNPRYASMRRPRGMVIGFNPADAKNPGGVPSTTPYWGMTDFDAVLTAPLAGGATLYRGPAVTD